MALIRGTLFYFRFAHFLGINVVLNSPTEMRLTTMIILTMFSITAWGQRLIGEYRAYYGHSLELKEDSTFRYEWRFDLASSWTAGQWNVLDRIVILNIVNIYDTLTREGKPDSLVLSSDTKSSRISNDEFDIGQISGSGQGIRIDRITGRLAIRGKRLYLMDKSGKVVRTRESGIWDKRKRPTYYFKTS